jgi:prevent-host-death family protein
MRPLQIARDIVPLTQLKSRASQIFRQLRDEKRPVVVTQNGHPAAVLITPEEYDRLQEYDRFLAAVREGLSDSEAGRLIDDDALSAELDAEFGT